MGGISATQMRAALRDNNDKAFIAGLPIELNDSDVDDIMITLGGSLDETSGAGAVGPGIQGYAGRIGRKLPHDRKSRRSEAIMPKYKKKEFAEEQLVNEVVDYLLGISVG